MESYEFEGKTAEEAINKASLELNISPEDLEFEIIEPGSAGIFGLVGTRKTKIRVTIKKTDDDDDTFKGYEDLEHFDSHRDDDVEKVDYEDDENDEDSEDSEDTTDYTPYLNIARDALDNILKLIPVEASVKGSSSKGKISLVIEGDTSGILIGRKGKTLDALQYIINKITNKKDTDRKIKVIIDSENYRQRRVDTLTQMALKIGNKAKKYKKPFSTSPLNPHDRRIVHLALKNVEKLETRSRGEGLLKRVIIIPKR